MAPSQTESECDMNFDTYESGLSMLFNVPEFAVGDSKEQIQIQFDGFKAINITLPDVDPANSSLFAHFVWKSSILLSKILLGADVEGKRVLELGAGAGIPSIIASLKGACVTASDYPDLQIIDCLRTNLDLNTTNPFKVVGHVWGDKDKDDLIRSGTVKYDVILLADCLWMSHQHDNLLEDLNLLLESNGYVLGVAGFHTGHLALQVFFEKSKRFFSRHEIFVKEIPLGHGFGENEVWADAALSDVSEDVQERQRYLLHFILHR